MPSQSKNLAFEQLAALAEAAEKYQMYSAMEICQIQMGYVSWLFDRDSSQPNTIEVRTTPF